MVSKTLSRRGFLSRSALVGCSLAASPLMTPVSFAAAPGDNRLVVIILRGGMDGLDVVQPYGDPAFAALRGGPRPGTADGPIDLDGYFALHPALGPLLPMWRQGQLGFVHAVSTPYRDKRSHFDGQDLLEAGIPDLSGGLSRDGWLNRLLQHYPGLHSETAYAIGQENMAVIDGPAPVSRWSPEADLALTPQAVRLARRVMQDDPAFAAAMTQALALAESDGDAVAAPGGFDQMMSMVAEDRQNARKGNAETRIASFAADRLRGDSRIATFSINGWDTHEQQARNLGKALDRLARTILDLKEGLGDSVWNRTTVMAMTEFGRTARLNGTQGTDHGTGGLMILAGGAVRGGRVVSDWPGLSEADLYDRRDLMPTRDVRAHAGWILRSLYGLDTGLIENVVFPGLDLGTDPRLLL
ncbi:DUF1501 domain-containing protein [Puniceibacterium sp. IMCC21224]|uniref:DUF1501 domain-containing protein n=1 Tax=Puniceibacterium sp. IMCC21224 TaxID=1618204 RepID=UPI00064DF7CC|nr:DUF1501 domain-containing protein [Puniceibacterium sp. IMCC21224]KMK65796.1 hypothetical protein IMCC21224_11632 [Puniceibacterium sp. IMCC21224]